MNVKSLQVYVSDKAMPTNLAEVVEYARENLRRQRLVFDKETTRRYFLAGGGEEARLEELWSAGIAGLADWIEHPGVSAGGAMMYIVAARKK